MALTAVKSHVGGLVGAQDTRAGPRLARPGPASAGGPTRPGPADRLWEGLRPPPPSCDRLAPSSPHFCIPTRPHHRITTSPPRDLYPRLHARRRELSDKRWLAAARPHLRHQYLKNPRHDHRIRLLGGGGEGEGSDDCMCLGCVPHVQWLLPASKLLMEVPDGVSSMVGLS